MRIEEGKIMKNRIISAIIGMVTAAFMMTACAEGGIDKYVKESTASVTQAVTQEVTQPVTEKETHSVEPITIATEEKTTESTTEATTEAKTESATQSTEFPLLTFPTVDEPTYIDGILVVNKSYGLPPTYNPGNDKEALAEFDKMKADAAKEGLNIYISSGFRSYDHQVRTYSRYVYYDGQEMADTYSARPGYSDHQTGLAFDLNSVDDSFGLTKEAVWVEEHCHEYGFIIRYPKGKEDITGYQWEPWHLRYLGIEKATAVYESGLSLEEYLGIDSVYPQW